MRTAIFSLSAFLAIALIASGSAALASGAEISFAPYERTAIPNGQGPGPAPRGTVSADFNGDGHPDIATISDLTYGDMLFVPNNGDAIFGAPSRIAGTAGVQGIDAGDVNGDGHPDIVGMTDSEVRVKLGDGRGGFSAGGTHPLTLGGQVEPRVMDLDNDGDLDIVAPSFTAIQTLINNGSGGFSAGPTSKVSGAGALSAISPATLDGDGRPDLFTVDGYSGTTHALLGDGAGHFAISGLLYGSGFVPEDIAALDLDNDGYDDAATIGSFSFTVTTGLTDGTGKFRSSTGESTQYSGPGPTSATAADFDRDGRTDLVISSLATYAPELKVLAGNGTAKMREVGDFRVAQAPQNPVVADYDGDGTLDIVTAGPGALSLLRNTTP